MWWLARVLEQFLALYDSFYRINPQKVEAKGRQTPIMMTYLLGNAALDHALVSWEERGEKLQSERNEA